MPPVKSAFCRSRFPIGLIESNWFGEEAMLQLALEKMERPRSEVDRIKVIESTNSYLVDQVLHNQENQMFSLNEINCKFYENFLLI